MSNIKKELITILNKTLEIEHADSVQYLNHAGCIQGPNTETFLERLKDIAFTLERGFTRRGKKIGKSKTLALYCRMCGNNFVMIKKEFGENISNVVKNVGKTGEA